MAEGKNIIEVNGKRYDARTGKLLTSTNAGLKGSSTKPTTAKTGVVLDFAKPKAFRNPSLNAHAVHAKASKSNTLMRATVKKPGSSLKKASKAVALDSIQKPKRVVPATIIPQPIQRLNRAEAINKSSMIKKFSFSTESLTKQTAFLTVKDAPADLAPPITAPVSHTANPFQSAIDNATSHLQPRVNKSKRQHTMARKFNLSNKAFATSSALLVALVIGGFFAYTQVPSVTMRVASAKAGIKGAMPGYKPSGFSVNGPIHFKPGEVAVKYQSNTDQRNFTITQRVSKWDNEALLKNFVNSGNRTYQTLQKDDKIIYIYDGNNATWIEAGIWYQVEGKADLSSDQLIRIADSL